MEERIRCQSCGISLGEGYFGTNEDGSQNDLYCTFCFQKGTFIEPDLALDDMITKSVEHMTRELSLTPEKARELAEETLPKLSRWRKGATIDN